jgi:hypothetical protein
LRTSYNVLGHFKLCTVLAGGFLIFQDNLNMQQAVGILLTLIGIFAYTHYKLKVGGVMTRLDAVDFRQFHLTSLAAGHSKAPSPHLHSNPTGNECAQRDAACHTTAGFAHKSLKSMTQNSALLN